MTGLSEKLYGDSAEVASSQPGLSKLAEIVLFASPFIYLVVEEEISILNYWIFYVIGALLVILNYIFLGQAYSKGNLSSVYPVSRAGTLLFLPLLAYLFIGEKIDAIGFTSISLIIIGIAVMQLTSFDSIGIEPLVSNLKSSSTLMALAAAFTTACYTLWDKHSISVLPPFIYFYAYTAITGIVYSLFILFHYPAGVIREEWAKSKGPILLVGFLNTFTYVLILYSLQTGKTSYVIALRQLSIAFGVLLGWKILRESFPLPRKIGVVTLLSGCVLIALAR